MAITSNPKPEPKKPEFKKPEFKKPAPVVVGPEEIVVDPKQEAKAQALAVPPTDGKAHDHVTETSN